jgi:preprotein translocase SecE subunit
MKKIKNLFKFITNPIRLIVRELKLVEWLTLKQTMNYTLFVLVISVFVGIIIVVFDTVFFNVRNVILDL